MIESSRIFNTSYRIKLIIWAAAALLLGACMIAWPFAVFRVLIGLLPLSLLAASLLTAFVAFQRKNARKRHRRCWLLAAVLLTSGLLLYHFLQWRDVVLWYGFALYLYISGWQNLRPAWQRGVDMQPIWRVLGSLTVWGFGALMLLMPSSGLSEALQLLGIFTACWGVFQLLLPPPRE